MKDFKNYFFISIAIIILQLYVVFILINNINEKDKKIKDFKNRIIYNERYIRIVNNYHDGLIMEATGNVIFDKDSLNIRNKSNVK